MQDPHFHAGGAGFLPSVLLIPSAALLAGFVLWWAHREKSEGLVRLAAAVLLAPWLLLLSGWGAAVAMLLFVPTSWVSVAVGIAAVIVSRKIRRSQRAAREHALDCRSRPT